MTKEEFDNLDDETKSLFASPGENLKPITSTTEFNLDFEPVIDILTNKYSLGNQSLNEKDIQKWGFSLNDLPTTLHYDSNYNIREE